MTFEDIGVVVIGRNEGQRLIDCLITVQSARCDVVYVDSGSADGSEAAARRMGVTVVELDANRPFTAARGRNEGFVALRALNPNIRFVQFIDGDCSLVPGWLEKARRFIAPKSDVGVVCGRRRERHPGASVYNQICDIEWDTPIGETSACGGDALVRAEAFGAVDGFRDELIAGEEPELCLRLREKGWRIWRLDAEMTQHDAAMKRFRQWWARAVRSGYGMTEVVSLHWHSPLLIWRKELARAVLWSFVLPVVLCLSALIHPVVLIALLIYPFQVCRIAIWRGPTSLRFWAYAFFLTVGKFAELQGILRFLWCRFRRNSIQLIEYK